MGCEKDDIKNKAKKAIDLVDGVDDKFKVAAFSVVFEKLLDEDNKGEQSPKQEVKKHSGSYSSIEQVDIQKKKEELAEKCGISLEELDRVLDIKTDYVQLLKILKGGDAEKQRLASKCILTSFVDVYQEDWIDSDTMVKSLEKSGVPSTALTRNLRQEDEFFSVKGRGKGAKLEYTVTGHGKISAYESIKKLSKGENPLESKSQ